ncbi:probable serine/threonine-protein kinase DDB_G0286627 [Nasonia vitripennis]|uniref:Protein kinase domain-containing protein n=1 Tax=Nasonia vitripennis TaxID=7425 RepID=A0A7M7PXY5_NASVI|nr:probable serine/threonine-protein kinase DDB_G0286627 [Nasonia vitripennis]
MAVFVDYGEIGFVMEYFESNTLRSIINRKLNLAEIQKQQICLQISKAIVNEYLVTKVCDMGLSRFEDMPESLKTTAGRTVGTVTYMAPEVLLYYESGNSAADVWALACVFVELYKEADVWAIPPNRLNLNESYKEIISTQKVPDLTSVPKSISNILKVCFDHDPHKRPKASTLLDIFKMLEIII